jgi:hypothetical protein
MGLASSTDPNTAGAAGVLLTCAAALDWELMKKRVEAQDSLALCVEEGRAWRQEVLGAPTGGDRDCAGRCRWGKVQATRNAKHSWRCRLPTCG